MTPIDPPLDKMAEAIELSCDGSTDEWTTEARAAWDAVAEGLGLREALIFGGRRHLVSERLEPKP